ncbi:transmembrane protein, putative [Rhizoctonia solani AG-3 Rhs1AP]|uniref:Transmembrane protein, putative n=1 Tax=Rhizoctonia solani AG-3 Rhs1AP TaxID=1086054 RepID=A0A0A1UKD9_9AGAM|nr:transmembrane protein, putative [Rhizoctonia solani AG-3 Rhs1AP]
MAFQSSMSRLAAVTFVLLSLGFLVQASPIAAPIPASGNELATIEARHDKNCYGEYCYGGNDIVAIMLQLQAAIAVKLGLLDGCLGGGDYASIILDIEGILYAAIGGIKGCKIGLLGLLTGKLLVIAKIWFGIVISVATHCGQWAGHAEFSVFLGLIVKIDLALKLCLLAIINLGGIFGGFLSICIGLFTQVHIALLAKVNFVLCLGALKIGGY